MNEHMKENIAEVKERIAKACEKAGRDPSEVTLIAVSKTMPVEDLLKARELGMTHFGENKVQEIVEKYDQIPKDQTWHMIGHLQRNKVKYIIDKVAMIHSVDSLRLAETISKEAAKKDVVMPVLIEVNVAGEESKFGVSPEDVKPLVKEISVLPNIRVEGLMTIAPFVENGEENRPVFRSLREISVDIARENIDNVSMNELSMGMTVDYDVAVEEGATMVRVGTAIFGKRNYSI